MEMTRILDESPSTPGRRQHMPRTIRSIRTPASLAPYSSSIRRRSTRPFIFAMIRAGRPGRGPLAADTLDEPFAQVPGREQKVMEFAWAHMTGEEIEQRGKVVAERVA